jgi:putative ABC transport system substrate-binding protein
MNFVRTILAILLLIGTDLGAADRKVPTIGLAIPVDRATAAPFQKAFREGLRELGYVDGDNVALVVRYSNGDPVKYRELIRELIAMRVDVLWGEAKELKEATTTIPIVSPTMPDPVTSGLVASLARPGGNLTGVSYQGYDVALKIVELTKELLPELRRLCVLFDLNRDPAISAYIDGQYRARARELGVSICTLPVRTLNDILALPKMIDKDRPQAVVTWSSPFTYQHRETLVPALASRVPTIGDARELADLGAIVTYSVDWVDTFERTASYVDKILKGAKAGDLPIEQPTKFDLVVNLKAARALGIKVPQPILVRAAETLR